MDEYELPPHEHAAAIIRMSLNETTPLAIALQLEQYDVDSVRLLLNECTTPQLADLVKILPKLDNSEAQELVEQKIHELRQASHIARLAAQGTEARQNGR